MEAATIDKTSSDIEVKEIDSKQQVPVVQFDGGRRAWCTLLGGFLASLATFGYTNAFGVYQDVYTRAGAASASAISWIGSTQLFCTFGMGMVAGAFLDKGYFRHTLFIGSVIFTFSLFMVSLAHHDKYYQLYLSQGLGMGIGAGLIYVPILAVQNHHWRKRRAAALGVVVMGSSIGGIIFPIMLNQLFKSSVGFAWGVRASGFIVLGLLFLSNILMSTNDALINQEKPKSDFKGIILDIPFMLGNFAILIINWGAFLPFFYLQLFSILHGVDSTLAFYTLAILNAGAIPGRIIPNIIADRFGPFNVLIPCTAACCVLLFGLFGVHTSAGAIVFALFYGFFSGAYLSLSSPVCSSFCRHPSEAGVRYGVGFLVAAFGALTGNPIAGALLGQEFQWFKPIIFGGIAVGLGTVMLMISRHYVTIRKGTHLV